MDLYAIFYDVLDNIYYALLAVVVCVMVYELIIIQYLRDERMTRKRIDSLRRINLLELPEGKTHEGTEKEERRKENGGDNGAPIQEDSRKT